MSIKLKVIHKDGTQNELEFEKSLKLEDQSPIFSKIAEIEILSLDSPSDLKEFIINGTAIRRFDLTPINSCSNLRTLAISNNKLQDIDLSPLRSCKNLLHLFFDRSELQHIDLSPLYSCTNLETLELGYNKLKEIDLTPLASFKGFKHLGLRENQLQSIDLLPLSSCVDFKSLDISQNPIQNIDLSPLASCHAFSSLSAWGILFHDLDITPIILNPNFNTLHLFWPDSDSSVIRWIKAPYPIDSLRGTRLNRPAPKDSWLLLHKIASLPHHLSIPIQSYVLNSLGLQEYGLIDTDISEFLCSISSDLSINEAREKLKPFLMETICRQIDKGGTTIGLDVEQLLNQSDPQFIRRLNLISELRDSEMNGVVVKKMYNEYAIHQFALTAYGFSILLNLKRQQSLRGGHRTRKRRVLYPNEEDFARIQKLAADIGYDFNIDADENSYYEPFEPKNMSKQMLYYLLGILQRESFSEFSLPASKSANAT